ncbi:hypothetical protein ATANTOWER_030039 [Ataeniobius toweri]|uniref:Uncharacterized protein n=1 Tax=Ataeniobius toweri TaxID=208326 RepID=A0ABU7BK52_9TELE|nr:hypothetical protein [Ataeniobius toweri]
MNSEVSCLKQFAEKSSDHKWLCLVGPAHLSLVSFPALMQAALILFTAGKEVRLTASVVVLLLPPSAMHHFTILKLFLTQLGFCLNRFIIDTMNDRRLPL